MLLLFQKANFRSLLFHSSPARGLRYRHVPLWVELLPLGMDRRSLPAGAYRQPRPCSADISYGLRP